MAKVFTITEGLENMGALRTGGQGSVYKGRRKGEIITAVKLLPTPIHTEDENDKNFRDFQNEVQKLKKVNEQSNPHVVKILNSGITESGSFPFIEMEFIEGPDLEELLKPPHDPVFSIREVIKVADQLSNALAHCHKVAVKHGDIKSNNVKFNERSGNYMLLDFGLAVMSDEQRRSSLRHAGAIEFMAPEQNEGKMLFQTDVYSFGVILFELLAGVVPFPLADKGETSRNTVMISHMETPVPDVLQLREKNLPASWTQEKKDAEMKVPAWLLGIIKKCLEKTPENRYENGQQLHEAVVSFSTIADNGGESIAVLKKEVERLTALVSQYQQNENTEQYEEEIDSSKVSVSKPMFFTLILLLIGLAGFAGYSFLNSSSDKSGSVSPALVADTLENSDVDAEELTQEQKDLQAIQKRTELAVKRRDSLALADSLKAAEELALATMEEENGSTTDFTDQTQNAGEAETAQKNDSRKYTLAVPRAYFYSQADEKTQRNSFLDKSNNAELTAVDEKNGFIYVVFFNTEGQITKGWLRKSDLRKIGI